MVTTRREFIERIGGSAAFLGLPAVLGAVPSDAIPASSVPADAASDEPWDLRWADSIKAKHRVVVDCAEIEEGSGVFRASMWSKQYAAVMGAKPEEMQTVLVLRHNAIALAMQQTYWDAYGIGKKNNVKHPVTEQPTDRNPALLNSTQDGTPADFDAMALDQFIARGGIALGCGLAFGGCVSMIAGKDKLSADEARKKAMSLLVDGVVLQPSGIFAVIRAQQAGCLQVRGS